VTDQLSGLDATFLEAETETIHLHGVGIIRLAAGEEHLTLDALTRLVERRLDRLAPLRQRLVTVPAGLDRPYWVEADPVLSEHIDHVDLPGDDPGEFEAFCASVAEDHLDRTRPLWHFWLVDGLPDNAQALVIKLHHSVSDGVGSLAIVATLLDIEPNPAEPPSTSSGKADRASQAHDHTKHAPGPLWLLGRAVGHMVHWPIDAARATIEIGGSAVRLAHLVRSQPDPDRAAPLAAPRLASSGPVSASRSVAMREIPMDRVKAVARAADVRVNDVVLATLAGATRTWLDAHDDLPDQPLVAAIPVSTRSAEDLTRPGNHVSVCFVHLATHVADPVERLRVTASSSVQGKEAHAAVGSEVLAHFASLALPITVVTSLRLYSGLGLPSRHPPAVNLVVSNVPGPTFPLYLAGRRADRLYALGPILDGAPLNVTAVSFAGTMGIGLIACPERLPDLASLADALSTAFDDLATALGC
jgi:WS/DGAT/MGAT family acyltransferase